MGSRQAVRRARARCRRSSFILNGGKAPVPRILLVDDDAETCRFLEELLEAPGRQFVSVQDPDSALARIRSDAFDLLVSDINLNAPRSGIDLLRRFRAEQNGP